MGVMRKVNTEKVNRLAGIFEDMRAMQELAAALIKQAFPVGAEVCWEHGERLRYAEVIEHRERGIHLDLKVRGTTGAEYWIGVWGILRAMVEDFKG
jgi:hypothetical protein